MVQTVSSSKKIVQTTSSGLGSLLQLLPTGTVFLYQFLTPLLTNNGKCKTKNKFLEGALIIISGMVCFFSTFTDSYKEGGSTIYGIVTPKGLWPSSATTNLKEYKLKFADFVHALFSASVFAVVALLDENTRHCFFPGWHNNDLLLALPIVIGGVASTVFANYPSTRHPIGYAESSAPSSDHVSNPTEKEEDLEKKHEEK